MRSIAALSLAFLVAALGCQRAGDDTDLPEAEAKPPKALLAVIELPSGTDAPAIAALASTVNPRFGTMAKTMLPMQLAEAIGNGVTSVENLDLAGPVRLFVVDPEVAEPIVVVARTKGKVTGKGGQVVVPIGKAVVAIGDKEAVAIVDNYAAHRVETKVDTPRAVAFLEHVMASYAEEIEAFPGKVKGMGLPEGSVKALEAEVKFAKMLAKDSEKVVLAVAGGTTDPHIRLDIVAKPKTALASWFALQSPSDFSKLEQLPPVPNATYVFEGSLHAGQLADVAMDLFAQFLGAFGDDAEALEAATKKLVEVMTGDMAMAGTFSLGGVGQMPNMSIITFYGVSDAAPARQAITDVLARMSGTHTMMGVEQTIEATPNAAEHAGVPIGRQVTRTKVAAGVPPIEQEVYFAVADGGGYYAMSDDGEAMIRAAIDRSQGKGPAFDPSPAVDAAIARAKKNQASAMMMMDFSGLGAPVPPVLMSLIFGERSGALTLRFAR